MENDIIRDVQVILSAQGEELDKVRAALQGEEMQQQIELLKAIAEEAGVSTEQFKMLKGTEIDFITDKTHLMKKLMTDGAPDMEEIEMEFKRITNKPLRYIDSIKKSYSQGQPLTFEKISKDW